MVTFALLSLLSLLPPQSGQPAPEPGAPPAASSGTPATAAPAPQATPTAANAELEALASRVETAHRPDGPVPPVVAFDASITLRVLDKTRDERGQVDLDVKYLEWLRPGSKKVQPLIRYEILDAAAPIVRGRDQFGYWQLTQGEPRDLTGADAAEDLAQAEQHMNLARQLVRFLSPGDVLRGLQQPGPVRDAELTLARDNVAACRTVTGRLAAFPLLRQGGEDAPVELQAWIGKADGRLLAVDATPLRDGKPDPTRSERVLLQDPKVFLGIVVPQQLTHLFQRDDGKLAPWSRVRVEKLDLRPRPQPERFDRR
jgi:hypothetical protein